MSFEPAATRRPVAIPKITISLDETPATDPETGEEFTKQSVRYGLAILYDDGSEMRRYGNLVLHLTQQQIVALQAFMADMRALAETEILP